MRSDLKKISRDLIVYSALIARFEPLDFKNDALAGVRANYFNSRCLAQSEKTEISVDGKPLSLSYTMKKGQPLAWKAMLGNQPYQTVKRESGGIYCVLSYNGDGMVYKRQFFDLEHLWLRTEYTSPDGRESAVLYPKNTGGVVALKYKAHGADGGKTEETLYPSLKASGRKCMGLIYSNSGMLWYDSAFAPADLSEAASETAEGFGFKPGDFRSDIYSSVGAKLDRAEYLTAEDVAAVSKAGEPEQPEPEEQQPYSAYDKIESILFEAHKTNKNLFGELAEHSDEEQKKEVRKELSESRENKENKEQKAAPVKAHKPVPVKPAGENDGQESVDEIAGEMVEAFGGNPVCAAEEPKPAAEPERVDYKPAEKPAPDSVIKSKSGEYNYYGALDQSGKRFGRGRTEAPDGTTLYDGEYLNDKRHGFGVCYYKEGSLNYVGSWDMGSREGAGVGYRLSDGTMHVGKWKNNAPDGFGARFDRDGDFLDVCAYVNGVRSGKSVSFDQDGNIVVKIWDNGELVGEKVIG